MHYVGHYIVLMIGKMLKGEVFKSWIASFVTTIMWIYLIKIIRNEMFNNIYYKKNAITILEKHVDANHGIIANFFENEVNSPMRTIL